MIVIYDPKPPRHDYLSPMYFAPMRAYASRNGIPLCDAVVLSDIKNSTVCCLADYLEPEVVSNLKNNGNKIVGFSVTDSSYVAPSCREAHNLVNIDLMFMLTGIQNVNHGNELVIDKDFKVGLETRQFLPDKDWDMFDYMHRIGKLQSLPYVHWERQPEVEARTYNLRSQKALIRGGHHMRRFILALKLMQIDKLDINSGFVTFPYFQESMNPQYRYCEGCRNSWRRGKRYPFFGNEKCTCPDQPLDNLGKWNNISPSKFCDFSIHFLGRDEVTFKHHPAIEKLMNGEWLPQKRHLEMLARITMTSDLKWMFSIYAAQRFWDAAMVGCINVLPSRTGMQDYFPVMNPFEHYLTYSEDLANSLKLEYAFDVTEKSYNQVSRNAKELYDGWMRPTEYAINTNLLRHIFSKIEEHTAK